MSDQFDHVSIIKKANVYFEGKCVSHTLVLADGSRKSVGVIFPSKLVFNTASPEVMEIIVGACCVKQAGDDRTRNYKAGESFSVPANSSFEIEVLDTVHYVCHFD
jgi:uncharacterized protein YaiE (UPF0345 family)